MKYELLMSYLLPVIGAALTALAGFLGAQLKKIYQKYVDDRTKEAVVRTCVKAVEQLYHDLKGAEKLERAKAGVRQMLEEKGIPISELEMDMLIESVVSEFNYGFAKDMKVLSNEKKSDGGDPSTALRSAQDDTAVKADVTDTNVGHIETEYSEEGGSV